MRRLFFDFLFCLLLQAGCLCVAAQPQKKIDSMLRALRGMKEDSAGVRLFGNLGRAYMASDPKEALLYTHKGLELAEKIDWKPGIANLHNTLGLLIGDTGNNTLAREHFEQSYAINQALDSKIGEINNLNNIGRSYLRESDFSRATDYFFKALTLAEATGNHEKIAMVGTNLTALFNAQKNYVKAAEYGEMTLKNGEAANAPEQIGKALMQLGVLESELKDTPTAKRDLDRALKLYEGMNNQPQVAMVLMNMADLEIPHYDKQLAIMLKAQAIFDETGPASVGSVGNIFNMGSTYYALALQSKPAEKSAYLKKAEVYLLRAKKLCEQTSNSETLASTLLSLSDLEGTKGNYKASLDYYKSGTAMDDSLFSQDKKNEIAGLEGKHDLFLKDNEIALRELRLSNQRRTVIGLIAGILLLTLLGCLIYWQSRNRKRTNVSLIALNDELDEANKVKAKFFGILSHDLRSPVSNLIHFLHLQKNDPEVLSREDQAHHQQEISESAENLLTNMEAMLLWSKEQMEDFKPSIRDVSVAGLFEYLQGFFGQSNRIQMQYNYSPGLVVSTDEHYMRIIMQNLTANAIKALKDTPDARIVWNARKEGATTVLSITDNGPGISPDQLKSLYDDKTTLDSRGGFGFHLVRDLARAIRYRISIQSLPGRGTTFTLSA